MFLWGDSLPGSWFADFPDKVAFFNILPLESLAYCSGSRGAWEKGLRASPLAPGTLRVSSRHSPGPAFHGLPWLLGQVLDKLLPLCGLQSRVRRFGVCGRDSHSLRLGFSLGGGEAASLPFVCSTLLEREYLLDFTRFVCELVRPPLVGLLLQLSVNLWTKLVMLDLFYNKKIIEK